MSAQRPKMTAGGQPVMTADGEWVFTSDTSNGADCCCGGPDCATPVDGSADFLFRPPSQEAWGALEHGPFFRLEADHVYRLSGNGALVAYSNTTVTITGVGSPDTSGNAANINPTLHVIINNVANGQSVSLGATIDVTLTKGQSLQLTEDPDKACNFIDAWLGCFSPGYTWPSSGDAAGTGYTLVTQIDAGAVPADFGLPGGWTGTAASVVTETNAECLPYVSGFIDVGGYYPAYLDMAKGSTHLWIRMVKTSTSGQPLRYESDYYDDGAGGSTAGARFILANATPNASNDYGGSLSIYDTVAATEDSWDGIWPWSYGTYISGVASGLGTDYAIGTLPSSITVDIPSNDYPGFCSCPPVVDQVLNRAFTLGKPSYSGGGITLTLDGTLNGRWKLQNTNTGCDGYRIAGPGDLCFVVYAPPFHCATYQEWGYVSGSGDDDCGYTGTSI